MQWSDVVKPPSRKTLREFAGLFLVVFLALAAWRWFRGEHDAWAVGLAVVAVLVGGVGLIAPALMRPIFTGWMMAAFPIGWMVARLSLALTFFGVVTPTAWLLRVGGRDPLQLRRRARGTYWTGKTQPASKREYFRQS
jgi:hypothetical protein